MLLSHMLNGPSARKFSPDNIFECITTEFTGSLPRRLRPQPKQSPQAVARRCQGTESYPARARRGNTRKGLQPSIRVLIFTIKKGYLFDLWCSARNSNNDKHKTDVMKKVVKTLMAVLEG